jgi:hypothetical protein
MLLNQRPILICFFIMFYRQFSSNTHNNYSFMNNQPKINLHSQKWSLTIQLQFIKTIFEQKGVSDAENTIN